MRERLIELLEKADETVIGFSIDGDIGILADHLLANGVIVPPVKVGQIVYVPWHWGGQKAVATVEVEEIKFYDSQMHYMFLIDLESDDESFNQAFGGWKIDQSIGETVFLTKEEAEKALAERRRNV